MAISFTNNWKNISDKLKSIFRNEFKNSLPVYILGENESTGSQYLQLDLVGNVLSQKFYNSEIREYSVNINYIFRGANANKASLDNILRYVSRIEKLMSNNTSFTLSDSTKAINCRIESTILQESKASYLVSFNWKCQHLSGSSEGINTN